MRLTLTKQTEYALRALVWLAQDGESQPASGQARGDGSKGANGNGCRKAAAIASAAGIPPVFAARVFAQLQGQGLLHARAGQHGGYTLARPATEISLLDVIEAVEGHVGSRGCVPRDAQCGTDGTCLLHDAWSASQEALRGELARTPLDDPDELTPAHGAAPTRHQPKEAQR